MKSLEKPDGSTEHRMPPHRSAAGFEDAELVSLTGYRTASETIGATFRARKLTAK